MTTKRQRNFSSREIIEQLGFILSHPKDQVQEENLPGLFPNYCLERYESEGKEVQLRCNRNKYYLRRWFLSRVLTFGNIGNDEQIIAAIIFNGYSAIERLFHIIVRRTINRNSALLQESYELCRGLYPHLFPVLPNVKDPETGPRFLVVIKPKTPKKRLPHHRIRNPSAVGGKRSQGITPLPLEPMSGEGPSNVDDLFLETLKLLSPK